MNSTASLSCLVGACLHLWMLNNELEYTYNVRLALKSHIGNIGLDVKRGPEDLRGAHRKLSSFQLMRIPSHVINYPLHKQVDW